MKSKMILATALILTAETASAQSTLPNPVRTCGDIRAYIGPDQTMTMDTFKSLLTAAGADLSNGHDQGLDLQCKAAGAVKHVLMIQRILGDIRLSANVVLDNGVCKLTKITVPSC